MHALLLDVEKAFDRVDHAILLGQCRSLGISGSSLDWIKSYLSARVIVTSVNGQLSSPQSISSGIPQGSVLGPLFYLLFFSSLLATVQACTPMLFADDTLVHNTSCRILKASQATSSCCDLQDGVRRVNTWALSWNTRFNASKSAALIVARAKSLFFRLDCI